MEPLVKRGLAVVQNLSERLGPDQTIAGQLRPEAGIVPLGFLAKLLVGRHASNACFALQRGEHGKDAAFRQDGFNRRWTAHGVGSFIFQIWCFLWAAHGLPSLILYKRNAPYLLNPDN